MNSTIKYYDDNAEMFIRSTVDADLGDIYREFLSFIPDGGRILDAGCGSGRDSKYFLEQGYEIEAFDASKIMCRAASDYLEKVVQHATFEEFSSDTIFEGIWACASLLHVKKDNLAYVINKLLTLLSHDGVLYCSWKYGNTERVQDDGKYYFDIDENAIYKISNELGITIEKIWITLDTRPNVKTTWINVILKK